MYVEKSKVRIPELSGGQWINSDPIRIYELVDKVVLVDFWDYTCVNCIRTLPYLKEWNRRYKDLGLLIIGVHAPEFVFSGIKSNVEKGIEEFGIEYPVILDNEYKIWDDFTNKYWPAKYISDKNRYIRYAHFGEGNYIETEIAIQLMLKEIDAGIKLPDPMKPVRDMDIPGIHCYRVSPELYFGHTRNRLGNPEPVVVNSPVDFGKPSVDLQDTIYLEGRWLITSEYAVPSLENSVDHAGIHLKYTSSEVNLVINPLKEGRFNIEIMQDGEYLNDNNKGNDVEIDRNAKSYIRINKPRMYNIVNNRKVDSHQLDIYTNSSNFAVYAFTFTSCII